jgi:hypothetical protein
MKILKISALVLALLVFAAACSAPARPADEPYKIKAAVLYGGDSANWESEYLRQSLLVNLTVDALALTGETPPLEGYDALYLDKSLLSVPDPDGLRNALEQYVKEGGAVFLDNAFHSFFSLDFLGASETVKLNALPETLTLSKDRKDYNGLRTAVSDFHTLYKGYEDFPALSERDYGVLLVCGSAEPLVSVKRGIDDEPALYALNRYGKGMVFFTNPLLPNVFSGSSVHSTNSANQIIFNEFAALVSREKYGFSAQRVFGSFGRPSIAWENETPAPAFAGLCEEYDLPFAPADEPGYEWDAARQDSPETVLALPRQSAGASLTLGAPAYLQSENYTWLSISGRNDLPMLAYCGNSDTDLVQTETDIETFAAYARRFVCNPVTAEQLAKSVAAAFNTGVTVTGELENGGLVFTASPGSDSPYETSTGLKVTFSDDIMSFDVSTDADVYQWLNGSLYIGLNKQVTVSGTDTPEETAHITRLNLPAEISQTPGGAAVTFLEGGMMQLAVADGLCRTFSEGWETRHTSEGIVFTKFGEASAIELHWDAADRYGE